MHFGLCIFCAFKMREIGWIVWFGWFALIISRKRAWGGRRPWQMFFADLSLESILRVPAWGSHGSGVLGVSAPCSQQVWGNLPAQGSSGVKLPKFLLHEGVIQVTVCFQHAKLTLVPILHVEWEIAGELMGFFSPSQPSTVKIHCFRRSKWCRRRIIFKNTFKGSVFKWLFYCDVHH